MNSPIEKSSKSPWAALHDVHAVTLDGGCKPVKSQITLPGSKSETNRALILAACAEGTTRLRGILKSDDSYWCLSALRQLGIACDVDGDNVRVAGGAGRWGKISEPVYIGSAGTIARFLPGVLCSGEGSWVLQASEQLSNRPIKPLIDAFTELGAHIRYAQAPGRFPIEVTGARLRGGPVAMSGSTSSQFISGALMASPLANNPVQLTIVDEIVQADYVAITLKMMKVFGVEVQADASFRDFRIAPAPYRSSDVVIEADASTASYFLALTAIVGGELEILNLSDKSLQPDIRFLGILRDLGCEVQSSDGKTFLRANGRLAGNKKIDMKPLSDVALTLAAMAPYADGPITIYGVEHIRKHESDRISAMTASLQKLGIRVEEHRDGMTVWPGVPKRATLDTYDDHRVAMSLAVLGAAGNGITLNDPGCVSKTCPVFFEEIKKLGVSLRYSN